MFHKSWRSNAKSRPNCAHDAGVQGARTPYGSISSTVGGRCRTNADGLNGVGGGSEAFQESLFYGAQAGTWRQALNSRALVVTTHEKGPQFIETTIPKEAPPSLQPPPQKEVEEANKRVAGTQRLCCFGPPCKAFNM